MLLDALEVLAPHIEHIALVGAHAIYLHTDDVVTGGGALHEGCRSGARAARAGFFATCLTA